MNSQIKNPVWITAVVVLAMAITLVGSSLMAGDKSPAAPTGHQMEGCSMMGAQAMKDCPMSKDAATMGMMNSCKGCTMADGKVTSVAKDGTLTVQVKPTESGKKALAGVKRGDTLPLMVMLGEDGKPCQMMMKQGKAGTADNCCAVEKPAAK